MLYFKDCIVWYVFEKERFFMLVFKWSVTRHLKIRGWILK